MAEPLIQAAKKATYKMLNANSSRGAKLLADGINYAFYGRR